MKKRVGVLLDDMVVSKQLKDLIELSHSASHYEITTLIVNEAQGNLRDLFLRSQPCVKQSGLFNSFSYGLFKILFKLESLVVKRANKYKGFYENHDLSKYDLEVINVQPEVSKSSLTYRYDAVDIDKIKASNLNLIVHGSSGVLKGAILTACPDGIISFDHADNDMNKGGPPGFWEVFFKHPRTEFVIQRLKDELDRGDILFRGYISTSWMYTLNLLKFHQISSSFLHFVLDDVTSSSPRLTIQNKVPNSAPLYTPPTPIQLLSYVATLATHSLANFSRKLSGKSYRWGVAYQFTERWNDVTLRRSKKIPNPKNRYLADPFVIKRDGKHYCFVEDYDYSSKRGCISVYEITRQGNVELGVALAEDFHLSYPYLFEHEGELYICPETSEKGGIRTYKCINFPLKWAPHKILMKDVIAVDTNIFRKDNTWWLITNLSTSNQGDHCLELHVFYSSSPFSDDWTPHSKNPVIFDPLKARNGGLIHDESGVYRVYQRQGFDRYGEAFGVSKITTIEPHEYVETPLFEIGAQFISGAKGTHTYNYSEGLLVFDYVEMSKPKTGVKSLRE